MAGYILNGETPEPKIALGVRGDVEFGKEDAENVWRVLSGVGDVFRSLHHRATRCQCTDDKTDSEVLWLSTEHLSMHGIRQLDACIEKLGGSPLGNFRDVFDQFEKPKGN
ncbi:MAG: hypothetical protein ABWY12_18580 [Burkholderiales bacterium]